MFILIEKDDGTFILRKKAGIREVSEKDGKTTVFFYHKKDTPVHVKETPKEFAYRYDLA